MRVLALLGQDALDARRLRLPAEVLAECLNLLRRPAQATEAELLELLAYRGLDGEEWHGVWRQLQAAPEWARCIGAGVTAKTEAEEQREEADHGLQG
jgi:hypothetical protein